MNNISSQIESLTIISSLVNRSCFGIDECNMIECFIPEVDWHLTVVYECLKNYRQIGMTKSGFEDRVVSLQTDLHNHLDKRIYLLSHFSKINLNNSFLFDSKKAPKIGRDPWLLMAQNKNTDEKKLMEASLHIRDILFSAHEVATVIPEKAEEFLKENLDDFNHILPTYLKLAKNLSPEECKKIQQAFEKLSALVKNNQLAKVDSQLSAIRKILRHSGISPSQS